MAKADLKLGKVPIWLLALPRWIGQPHRNVGAAIPVVIGIAEPEGRTPW